jgi:HAD superfamily hydrolase (TIGR01459 family)
MSQLTFKHLMEASNDYDVILFDLWGVIVEGADTYPGVVDAVNKIMKKTDVIFLSNAPRPDFIVARNLGKWGLENVTPEMVLTSGDIARSLIDDKRLEMNGKTPIIYHLGADRNDDILVEIDYEETEDIEKADIFLLSTYRDEHEDINEFDELLEQAAKRTDLLTLCSNPDTTIPKNGIVRYCAGYFAEKMEKFGGKVIYTGKPKSIIYDEVIRRKNKIKKDRILMVGDTFETDILGANIAGIHSALVMSGNADKFHNMHDSLDSKLSALYDKASDVKMIPTFVTKIVE